MAGWVTQKTARAIQAALESGRLGPDGKLPPERKMAEALGVSRSTVRSAIECMKQRGELETRAGPGRGTYVGRANPCWGMYDRTGVPAGSKRIVNHRVGAVRGLPESIEREGARTETEVVKIGPASSPMDIPSSLERFGGDVLEVVRARKASGEAIALETAYLPLALYKGVAECDFKESVYSIVEWRYGIRIGRIVETLELARLKQREARLLEVPAGSLAVLSQSTAFNARGDPVEASRDLYRADRARFVIDNRV